MKTILIAIAIALSIPQTSYAQDISEPVVVTETQDRQETAGRIKLRAGIIRAGRSAMRKGDISRREFNRIRVATLLPSVMDQVEDAAIMQISASGEDTGDIFECSDDGKINRASIDWDQLAAFLEKLLPIILQIITIFAGL
jgi:hypothetical protein